MVSAKGAPPCTLGVQGTFGVQGDEALLSSHNPILSKYAKYVLCNRSGGLKILTKKSQKHQGNKEKAASRTTFHLQIFAFASWWLEKNLPEHSLHFHNH